MRREAREGAEGLCRLTGDEPAERRRGSTGRHLRRAGRLRRARRVYGVGSGQAGSLLTRTFLTGKRHRLPDLTYSRSLYRRRVGNPINLPSSLLKAPRSWRVGRVGNPLLPTLMTSHSPPQRAFATRPRTLNILNLKPQPNPLIKAKEGRGG